VSPVYDYYDLHAELGERLLAEWAFLDTHDGLTDRYKHLRSVSQIRDCLRACGLTDIEVRRASNGVEARARKSVAACNACDAPAHHLARDQ
jgi:hypothetical protein